MDLSAVFRSGPAADIFLTDSRRASRRRIVRETVRTGNAGWVTRGASHLRQSRQRVARAVRPRNLTTAAGAIGAVLVVAGWSLLSLLGSAETHHHTALRASQLSTAIEALDANEWQARADQLVTPELSADIEKHLGAVDSLITQVSGARDVRAHVAPVFHQYRRKVLEELGLLRQRQIAAAISWYRSPPPAYLGRRLHGAGYCARWACILPALA